MARRFGQGTTWAGWGLRCLAGWVVLHGILAPTRAADVSPLPGTSPLTSLLLAMNMGATLFRLTVDECLAGVTREAARAIGRWDEMGSLEVGKACNLAIWDATRPVERAYWLGRNPLRSRVFQGVVS